MAGRGRSPKLLMSVPGEDYQPGTKYEIACAMLVRYNTWRMQFRELSSVLRKHIYQQCFG